MKTGNKRVWSQRVLWIVLAICGLYYGLRQTSYWLYGDSANFIIDANKLRRGYFSQNLEAWKKTRAGEPAVHDRLVTEGGFPALLWVSRAINPNLPFTLNGFVAPLFFAAMGWLLHLTGSKRGPPLAFLLFIIVFFIQEPMRVQLQRYCFPYRDMPAHTLALLSLCCALKARASPRPLRWMLLSGWLLGFGIWFRGPVFLFIPAAAFLMLRVALQQASTPAKIRVVGIMAAGGLLGLAPLFAQNVFEGKAFYQSGQMDIMVSAASLATNQPAAATVSLSNASFNAWPQLRLLLLLTPSWAWILIAIGLVQTMRKDRLRAIVLLSVAITFYLFYACYIKPVDRYIWMVNFMLLPFAVTWIADLIPQHRFVGPGLIAAASLCLLLTSFPPNRAPADHAFTQDTRAFKNWINFQITEPTLVMTPSHALQAWIANYADPHISLLKRWPLHRRDEDHKVYELPFDFKGTPHDMALLLFGDEDGRRFPSVWRDDLLNEYALLPRPERLPLMHHPMAYSWLEIEQLAHRSKTQLSAAVFQTGAETLYITAKAYETPTRKITLKHEEQVFGETTLQSGPNILTFSNPKTKLIELHADGPLPGIPFLKLGRIPALRHDFTGYGNMMSVSNYVRDIELIIYGYQEWTRDWGHSDYFPSTPLVRAKDQMTFRVPPQPQQQSLRVFLTTRVPVDGRSAAELIAQLATARFSTGAATLTPTIWFIGEPYAHNNTHLHADVIYDVFLAAGATESNAAVTLEAGTLHPVIDLLLLRTEYQAWNVDHTPLQPQGSKVYVPRSGQKWAKGIPDYFPRFSELEKLGSRDGFETITRPRADDSN